MIKFKGYNTKDEWRDVVVTMVKYGAELKEPEIEMLVDYLGKHFSRARGLVRQPVGRVGLVSRVRKRHALPARPALPALAATAAPP